jgi:serine/threonine protein kinase/HEAT repeat protein
MVRGFCGEIPLGEAAQVDDPLIGSQLGHFRIESVIAEGGMGVIYKATHDVIGRQAAIKVLSEKYSSDKNMIKRLHREARSVNRIGHPAIIDIFDFGQTSDHREYFVMEYVPGQSLAELMSDRGRLPWSTIAPILAQTLDALAATHDLGIIHRDVKPENILVLEKEGGEVSVKVLDFGIAKSVEGLGPDGEHLTRAGSVMGTPEYVSPEQIRGREVDGRADLYAVGVILFEMVMGRRPYDSDQIISLLMSHIRDPIPPMDDIPPELGIPPELPSVVHRAMAKDPAQRFANAREFAQALGLPVSPPRSDQPSPLASAIGNLPTTPGTSIPSMPYATYPAPRMTTPGSAMPTDTGIETLKVPSSPLRWILPLAVFVVAAGAIGAYFAFLKTPPKTEPGAGATKAGGAGTAAGGASGTQPATKLAKKVEEIDLPALYEKVRRTLRSGISNTQPEVRGTCVKGLGDLRDVDAFALLTSVLKDDTDRSVRSAAAMAISAINDPSSATVLHDVRSRSDDTMRVWLDEALMKLNQPEGREGLVEALQSQSKEVRFQAALALGEAGDEAALPVLTEVAKQAATLDRQTVIALLGTLAKLGHKESFASLEGALDSPDRVVKLGAAEAMARLGNEKALATLSQLLATGDRPTQLVSAKILASLGDYSGLEKLGKAVEDKDETTRRLAADGLGSVSDKSAVAPLAIAIDDAAWPVRSVAADSLARIFALMPTALVQQSQDWLKTALANRDWSVRHAAVGVSSEMDPELAVSLLGWAFKDKDERVRIAAVTSLDRLRSRKAVPLLTRALADSSEEVRVRAAGALAQVGDRADKETSDALAAAAKDRSEAVSVSAAGALLAMGDESYSKQLEAAAASKDEKIRRTAMGALGSWKGERAERLLLKALKDKSRRVRFAAARALARRGNRVGADELRKAIGKGSDDEGQALQALQSLGIKPTQKELELLARANTAEARKNSLDAADSLPADKALALLRKGSTDKDGAVRLAAAKTLSRMAPKTPAALPLLQHLARDPNPAVRAQATLGLAGAGKARKAVDMGSVKPVAPIEKKDLPEPPRAPTKAETTPSPTVTPEKPKPPERVIDDKQKIKQYKFHLSQAAVALGRGKPESALDHLKLAQRFNDPPPVFFEFGQVYFKLALRDLNASPATAKKHLAQAKRYYELYLQRAPTGKQAGLAQKGLRDIERVGKRLH